MDDSRRFRPPPSSFDDHLRFHAPFPSMPPPPPPPPTPPYHNPAIRGPNPWATAPPPLDWPPCTNPAPHPPQSFFDEEREAYRKRMRIDDPAQTFHPLASRISFEDERRLNLIRDHGIEYPPGVYGPGPGFAASNGPLSYPEHTFGHQGYPLRASEIDGFRAYPAFQNSQRFEASSQLNHLSRYHGSLPPATYVPQEQQLHFHKSLYISPTQSQYTHNDDQSKVGYHNQYAEMVKNHHEYQHPNSDGVHRLVQYQSYPLAEQYGSQGVKKESVSTLLSENGENCNMAATAVNHTRAQQLIPPLPSQPLPSAHQNLSPPSLQGTSPMPPLTAPPPVPYPVMTSNAANMPLPPGARVVSDSHLSSGFYSEPSSQATATFATKALPLHQSPLTLYAEEQGPSYPSKHLKEEKHTVVDACHLFRQPHRASRPDHFVIILRGLPGSGKSYLAKALRDVEVENGGSAPRIHAMDDYFMVEVEKKVEENGGSRSSSSRGKKQVTKKVIEYCYEPEMEEAYRSSMLKAFKKTLDEGIFTFIIVDDRNLRVADFAQFWAIAKRSGYEVYLLEATYKDPAGCAVRNIHGFTLDDIKKMADQWEDASSLYLQLDVQSLFHGDDLRDCSIQEVDMDMDDEAGDTSETHGLKDREGIDITEPITSDHVPDGLEKVQEGRDDEEDEEELASVTELEKSKWSKDWDDDFDDSVSPKDNSNALSGLLQTYGKSDKSVRWGDQIDQSGFSISAVKRRRSISSLIIGPGSGYNLNSNPLQEKDSVESYGKGSASESKKRFHEQLQAERESFKAVFDRRKQRIGGLRDAEDG